MVLDKIFKVAHKIAQTWKEWEVFAPRVLLALIGFALLTLFVQLSLSTSRAANYFGVIIEQPIQSNAEGSEAEMNLRFTNENDSDATIVVVKARWKCKKPGPAYGSAVITCTETKVEPDETQTIVVAPGDTKKTGNWKQPVGGTGNCGAAQVDMTVTINGQRTPTDFWGVAFKPNNCEEPKYTCQNNACQLCTSGDCNTNKCSGPGDPICNTVQTHFECDSVQGACTGGHPGPGDNEAQCNAKCKKVVTHYKCNANQTCAPFTCNEGDPGCSTSCDRNDLNACKNQVTKYKCNANNSCAPFQCYPGTPGCETSCDVNSPVACQDLVTKYKCDTNLSCAPFQCYPGTPGCLTSCDRFDPYACQSTVTKYKCDANDTCAPFQCYPGTPGCVTSCDHNNPNSCKTQSAVCNSLSLNPSVGSDPVTVTANLSGQTNGGGSIVAYRFAWGDGTETVTGNSQTTHTYNIPGTFTVVGFVKDNLGNEVTDVSRCVKEVTVNCTDCTEKTHVECINNQCQIRSGDGPQSCSSDCGQAHHVCRNESCQYIAGALRDGDVLCASNKDCQKDESEHLECRSGACTIVKGAGSDTCSTDANCQTKPTHTVCRDEACITLAGSGKSQCIMSSDCVRTVVYETIPNTGPEMPILGGLFGSGILGWFIRKLKF